MRENRDAFIHELTLLQHQVQDLKEVFASLATQNTQSFHHQVNYNFFIILKNKSLFSQTAPILKEKEYQPKSNN